MERGSFVKTFGGWTLDPFVCVGGKLPQKLASGFYEAFEKWDGALFTPLVYCGTQVVNGTNYMFICKVKYTTLKSKTAVAKVVLHETLPTSGLFGEFSVLSVETVVDEAQEGGYRLQPFPYIPGDLTSDPIAQAFEDAKIEFVGTEIFPIAFCGTQSISPGNSNSMFICKSTITSSKQVDHIDAVVLNEKDKHFSLAEIIELA